MTRQLTAKQINALTMADVAAAKATVAERRGFIPMLTATTMIYLTSCPDGDYSDALTWEAFAEINSDGMTADEIAEIKSALEDCGVYRGGGGAAAEYELRLAPKPENLGHKPTCSTNTSFAGNWGGSPWEQDQDNYWECDEVRRHHPG